MTPLTPHTYVQLTASYLWENLPQILLAGLLFSLCCAPAFVLLTLGLFFPALVVGVLLTSPAWAALLALETALVGDQPAPLLRFFKFWLHYWGRSVRLAALIVLPLLAAIFTLALLAQPDAPALVWLGLAADGLGLLVMGALALYAFPLLVRYDLALYPALRNSLVLASRYLGNTLGMLSLGVLCCFAVVYLSPALLLILPAVWGLFLVTNCRLVVQNEQGSGVKL